MNAYSERVDPQELNRRIRENRKRIHRNERLLKQCGFASNGSGNRWSTGFVDIEVGPDDQFMDLSDVILKVHRAGQAEKLREVKDALGINL